MYENGRGDMRSFSFDEGDKVILSNFCIGVVQGIRGYGQGCVVVNVSWTYRDCEHNANYDKRGYLVGHYPSEHNDMNPYILSVNKENGDIK